MTPIKLKPECYRQISDDLLQKYGQKSMLINWKKQNLGWTVRLKRDYHRDTVAEIYVDFWEEDAKSLFLLEHSDKIIG